MSAKSWFLQQPWGSDVRAAIVGSVTGSIFGSVVALCWELLTATTPPITVVIGVDNKGQAQPALMFSEAVKTSGNEQDQLALTFDPPSLMKITICEYAILTGRTYKEIVLSYIDRYPMCFSVSQQGANKITIKPNRVSGLLKSEKTTSGEEAFFCKC